MEEEFRYSEIFSSIQGEGKYTGVPTVWYRAFLCNLQCNGFGQENPADPTTWDLPYENFDITGVSRMEDLPVFSRGCDSSYSWSKKFKHLAPTGTAVDIAQKIMGLLKNETNPQGLFKHPRSQQWTHMAFTGGEPMLRQNQRAIVGIMQAFEHMHNKPKFVTIETNGTQPVTTQFAEYFTPDTWDWTEENVQDRRLELFWSISPKLYVSGESWDKTIKPEVVKRYNEISNVGQLKYVVDGSQRAWDEVERATELYRSVGVDYPVYIMPVAARREDQEKIQAMICDETIRRGYNFSARLHCWIYGNTVGT